MSFQFISINHLADHNILTDRHFGRLLVRDFTTLKKDREEWESWVYKYFFNRIINTSKTYTIYNTCNNTWRATKSKVFHFNPVLFILTTQFWFLGVVFFFKWLPELRVGRKALPLSSWIICPATGRKKSNTSSGRGIKCRKRQRPFRPLNSGYFLNKEKTSVTILHFMSQYSVFDFLSYTEMCQICLTLICINSPL